MVAAPAASKLALRELTCRFGTVTAVDRATLALAGALALAAALGVRWRTRG